MVRDPQWGGRKLGCFEIRGIYSAGLEAWLYVRQGCPTLPWALFVLPFKKLRCALRTL